jgi:glycine oxidase
MPQMSQQVIVVGCGIVGAMIAYELAQISGLQVTVVDCQPPAQASTGAALGVLMGIISQKTKGRAWTMRQSSIARYAELLPELEAILSRKLPWNQQGILKLGFAADDLAKWQSLVELRQRQGWRLELWLPDQVAANCPQVCPSDITGGLYSPQDYQVDPTALTLALVEAAKLQGAEFRFDVEVQRLEPDGCLQTSIGELRADWVVISAGLGSMPLMPAQSLVLAPVLGQAIRVRTSEPLGKPEFQPVITGHDIHLVPLGGREYWVGATVEFESGEAAPSPARLEEVWQGAIALWPELASATRLASWSGLRPRPVDRPAPVAELLVGCHNVFLATGHYRNGVLLAPATAQLVRAAVTGAAL